MVKRIIIPVLLLLLGYAPQNAAAQNRLTDQGNRLLDECRTLFSQGDYGAAGTVLAEWEALKRSTGVVRSEEIDYMRTVISAENDLAGSLDMILGFMEKYPQSIYYNHMEALLGSSYFACREYRKALECFDETDPLLLEDRDSRRLVRHNAVSMIRCGQTDEGYVQLSILERLVSNPETDEDIVFYKAYVDYARGNMDKAKTGFEKSLGTGHSDEARLYLADIELRGDGDYAAAYETAREMVESSEDTALEAEAERVLGEYMYRKGNYAEAASLLTSYLVQDLSADPRYDMYLLGMSCFRLSDMDGAIDNLSKVAEGNDDMAQNAALHVGLASLAQGNKEMARMYFGQASSMPGRPEAREQALYNYAMIVHETSFSPFAESVTSFERFLNEFPDSKYAERVSSYLVDVYLNTPSYDAALESISKLRNPGTSILAAKLQLLFKKAMDQMASGDYDGVPKLLTDVISLDRYDHKTATEAFFWRGEAYYRMNELSRAETDYKRYLAQAGDRRTRSVSLSNYGLGYVYYRNQEYDKAWPYFRTVVDLNDNTGVGNDIIADACLRTADCLFYGRQYDAAKEYYTTAINLNMSIGDYALYQTALVNGLQRNYDRKIQDLNRLLDMYPESPYVPSALYEQGRAYQQTDKSRDAVRVFSRIKSDYPGTDLARKASAESALIYYQNGNYDDAIEAYKEVISKYPGSDEARTALVDLKSIYVEKGDVNSYLEYAGSVQGAAPIAANERDSLSYAAAEGLFSRGEKDEALERFGQYLNDFPNGAFAPNAWYYQGILLEEQNDYERAYESYMHVTVNENSRLCESAMDRAAVMAWNVGDWETAMDTYIRLYDRTTNAERQRRSLYSIVYSAGMINEYDAVIQYADKALQSQQSKEQVTEIKYFLAKALLSKGNRQKALPLLEELSKDTRSQYGAESDYLLSQTLFDNGDREGAEKVIMAFIKEGTPHMYWLARSFILLSDICKAQGKDVEARQYLLSLKNNYTENDDIAQMIEERLE